MADRTGGPRPDDTAAAELIEPEETRRPEQILADADAAIVEAEARALQIEEAVRQGDPTVTMEDVEAAERQSRWARMRRGLAEAKAAVREQELREAAYARLIAETMPAATAPLDEVTRLMAVASTALDEALTVLHRRNEALMRVVRYATRDGAWTPDGEDGLTGRIPQNVPSWSEFEYQGQRYRYASADEFLARLLRPFKGRVAAASGGPVEWMTHL